MRFFCCAIGHVDAGCLLGMFYVRRFFHEWLGIPCWLFERIFIGAYIGLWAASLIATHRSPWWMLIFLVITLNMWLIHKGPDRLRFLRMISVQMTVSRVFLLILVLWGFLICALLPPYHFRYLWGPAANLTFAIFQFAVCLPKDDGGERGKRAKLAAEKLRALFGTSWETEPLARPV